MTCSTNLRAASGLHPTALKVRVKATEEFLWPLEPGKTTGRSDNYEAHTYGIGEAKKSVENCGNSTA